MAAELFEAISHPLRIQILRTLLRSPLGFSELKRKLGISSSGNLTHHLHKLASLVETDENGNYALTSRAQEAMYAIWSITSMGSWGEWILYSQVMVGGLIFYSLYLTVNIIIGWADMKTLMTGLLASLIFVIIFYLVTVRWHQTKKYSRTPYGGKWNKKWEN